jgi:hypothetical protein
VGGFVSAAPFTRDLGAGLTYLRASALPADLPGDFNAPACVLDLRYGTAGSDAAPALATWLRSRSAAQGLVLVLLNAATPPAVRAEITRQTKLPGLLTLGPQLPDFASDITVATDPAEEQRAYHALPDTADLAILLDPAPPKVRHDEAAIEQAMNATDPIEPETGIVETAPAANAPPPPVDRALLRAVQIHRGWLALGPAGTN